MAIRDKRILWLQNHTTMREGEVAMLIRLGYEVYTPKHMPDRFFRSGTVTYEYDRSLSIPPALLKRMNQFNFYRSAWPASLAGSINKYFGMALCGKRHIMLNSVCEAFKGDVYLRSFGAIGELKNNAYFYEKACSPVVVERIRKKDRIWFAPSYRNIVENEPHWLQRISVTLPLSLPPSLDRNEDQWKSSDGRILFVCPEIRTQPYYRQIYTEFKQTLGDLPHVIAGAQSRPVLDDPNVTGYVPQERYEEMLKSCAVMFYHSREARHLHYHPLEAILCGMPVVYMTGGMLDQLAGEKLPGACETVQEARRKIVRILSGDASFAQDIIDHQKVLLREFRADYVERIWRDSFPASKTPAEKEPVRTKPPHLGKPAGIGIWMHETNPGGFVGEGISRLLAQLVRTAQRRPDVHLTIACVSWVRQAIVNYMEELGVDVGRLAFLTLDDEPPVLFRLYAWWAGRRPRISQRRRPLLAGVRAALRSLVETILKRLVSLRGISGFLAIVLAAAAASPFLVLYGFYKLAARAAGGLGRRIRDSWPARSLRNHSASLINALTGRVHSIYHRMVKAELELLAEKAGRHKAVDAWFFPYPRNEYLSKFNQPIIVGVPDVVYMDFPTPFSREHPELLADHQLIRETIRRADAVIAYSDHVREHHILKPGFQAAGRVHVIRHAPIELNGLIHTGSASAPLLKHRGSRIIREYLETSDAAGSDSNGAYIQSLPFGEFDYLLVSSQTRPHKNHFNLLKAHRGLLREQYFNVKLIFTGAFSPEMQEYIDREKLHLDVLSIRQMPPRVHAAFFACAKLALAPTLFEGGFPFVFSEALSVGTPVLLSDIPAVRELLPDGLRHRICFDPYDVGAMQKRIAWALEHTDELLVTEKRLFRQMKKVTWEDVAEDYLRVFLSVVRGREAGLPAGRGPGDVSMAGPASGPRAAPDGEQIPKRAEEAPLCFIHIPKTAGTSFTSILRSLVPPDEFMEIAWHQLFTNGAVDLDRFKLLAGHIPIEIRKLLARPPVYLTMLRDPVERALSQYAQSRRFPQHWAYDRLQTLSLEEYIDDPDLQGEISNVQTWMLGLDIRTPVKSLGDLLNPRELPDEARFAARKNPDKPVWKLGLHIGVPAGADCTHNGMAAISPGRFVSLDLAKDRLESFAFIGLKERFPESMNLLAYEFGVPAIRSVPNLREAPREAKIADVPERVLHRLRELNSLDLELYDFAKRLFEQRYTGMLADLHHRYRDGEHVPVEELLDREYRFGLNLRGMRD